MQTSSAETSGRPSATISKSIAAGHAPEHAVRRCQRMRFETPRPTPRRHFAQETRIRFGEQHDGIGLRSTRKRMCGTLAMSIVAPSPPANAISAMATASPPSLKSWQARTRPAEMAACTAANVSLGQLRIDLRHAAAAAAHAPAAKCEPPISSWVVPTTIQQIARAA